MSEIDAIDPAKSSYSECELPTGFIDDKGSVQRHCVIREMTGVEEDLLMSSSKKSFQKTQTILENCILRIGGTEQDHPSWSSIIKNLVHTDRLFLLVQIRIASLGSNLNFEVICPSCSTDSLQEVSLYEFKVKGMTDPSMRTWKGKLPKSGGEFTARVQTGYDDEKPLKDKDRDDAISLLIAQRLVELNGKSPVTVDQIKKLSIADRQFLRKDLKSHEGEMDDKVEMVCPSCDHKFESAIDLTSSNFFFPSEI